MLKIDLHIHSIASGHSLNTVTELALEAKEKNIDIIGISEHGPSMEGAPHDGYFWISEHVKSIKGVTVLLGIEANIINTNGKLDLNDSLLSKQKIVLAGLHERTPYKNQGIDKNTKALINAMENPFVDIISHPYRPEFPVDIEKIVLSAKRTNTLLELNNLLFSRKKDLDEIICKYKQMIAICKKQKVKLIIGSDAHFSEQIGSDENIIKFQNELGVNDSMIANNEPKLLINKILNR